MITRITIEKREIFDEGYEFPITGAYEKLVGGLKPGVTRLKRLAATLFEGFARLI